MQVQPLPGDSTVLTRKQVAALFNVSGRTVSRWVRQGKLPVFRTPGGISRFYRHDIEYMLASGKRPDADDPEAA